MNKTTVRITLVMLLLATSVTVWQGFLKNEPSDVKLIKQPVVTETAEVVEQRVEREKDVIGVVDKTPISEPKISGTNSDLTFFMNKEGHQTTKKLIIADLQAFVKDWVEKSGGWRKFLNQTEIEQKILIDNISRKYIGIIDSKYKIIYELYFIPRLLRTKDLMKKYDENKLNPDVVKSIQSELRILTHEVDKEISSSWTSMNKTILVSYRDILEDERYSEYSISEELELSITTDVFNVEGVKGLDKLTEEEKNIFDESGGGKSGVFAIIEHRINGLYDKGIDIAHMCEVIATKPRVTDENEKLNIFTRYSKWHEDLLDRIRTEYEKSRKNTSTKRDKLKKEIEEENTVVLNTFKKNFETDQDKNHEKFKKELKNLEDMVKKASINHDKLKKEIEEENTVVLNTFKENFETINYHQWQLDTIKYEGVPVDIPNPKTNYTGFIGWYLWYLQHHVCPSKLENIDPASPEYEEISSTYFRFDKTNHYNSRVRALFELRPVQMAKVKSAHDKNHEKFKKELKTLKDMLKKDKKDKLEKFKSMGYQVDLKTFKKNFETAQNKNHEKFKKELNALEDMLKKDKKDKIAHIKMPQNKIEEFKSLGYQVDDLRKLVNKCKNKIHDIIKGYKFIRKSLDNRLNFIGNNVDDLCPNKLKIVDIKDKVLRNYKEVKDAR